MEQTTIITFLSKGLFGLFVLNYFTKALKWLLNYTRKVIIINKIKGPPMLPFVGNLHQLKVKNKEELFNQFCDYSKQFKNELIWRHWIGCKAQIIFHKPEALDILFSSISHTQKSDEYAFMEPWLGQGLITSYGEKWSKRRKLISVAFHSELLDKYIDVINDHSMTLINIIEQLVDEGQEIDVEVQFKLCALDIICEAAMGKNINAQKESGSEYVKTVSIMNKLILDRLVKPHLWSDFIYNFTSSGKENKRCLEILHNYSRDVIIKRDSDFDSLDLTSQKRIAFLDILIKAKRQDPTIKFEDIREEVDSLMFAGHKSSAVTLCWACQLIGNYPLVQEKLQKEIDEIFGDELRILTNDDLPKLKYLECVIKETLRLFPPSSRFGRKISEDALVGGHKILKGETAIIYVHMIHRDERYYPEPEKFDPDRFLPENSKSRHQYSFLPFSAGKRSCIGQRFSLMEIKIILAYLLRKFELKSLTKMEDVKLIADLILIPNEKFKIEFKKRVF